MAVLVLVGCNAEDDGKRPAAYDLNDLTFTELPTAGFESRVPDLKIGALSSSDGYVFGLIQDAILDSRDRIYVLDSRIQRISVFDLGGALIGEVGREGRGPGEFYVPEALAFKPDGTLQVLDPGNARIISFSVSDNGLSLNGSTRIEFRVHHFCYLGDRLFLLGLHAGKIIHEVSGDGQILHSFGDPYEAEATLPGRLSAIHQKRMSDGFIACSEQRNRVIYLPHVTPEIVAFAPSGVVLWRTMLQDYLQMRVELTERGTMRYLPDPDSGCQYQAARLLLLSEDTILAQLGQLCLASLGGYVRVDSRFVALESGKELAATDTIPLVAGVNGTSVVTWSNNPFPHLAVTPGSIFREHRS